MDVKSQMTPDDLEASAQANDIRALKRALRKVRGKRSERMLDLGCGYGGVTKYVASYFCIPEMFGVDMDEERLSRARLRGIKATTADLSKDSIPFPDKYFGLVISFGVLEHLIYFDNLLSEGYRVLEDDGYFLLAMPNLGSYANRMAILLGYQPRDVEISAKFSPGIMPGTVKGFFNHVHAATLHSMKQLLTCYGFRIIGAVGSSPFRVNPLVDATDMAVSFIPSLSRRFIIVARK